MLKVFLILTVLFFILPPILMPILGGGGYAVFWFLGVPFICALIFG